MPLQPCVSRLCCPCVFPWQWQGQRLLTAHLLSPLFCEEQEKQLSTCSGRADIATTARSLRWVHCPQGWHSLCAPCPVPRCPAAPHCCLCEAQAGWPGLPPQGPCWGVAGCSCSVPVFLLGSSPTGDMGSAETRCLSSVAEDRQQSLLRRDEALIEGCQEDWGERPGPSQLKGLSAVKKK